MHKLPLHFRRTRARLVQCFPRQSKSTNRQQQEHTLGADSKRYAMHGTAFRPSAVFPSLMALLSTATAYPSHACGHSWPVLSV
eukprot:7078622-Lingulodinium_polyedra.AAC.1